VVLYSVTRLLLNGLVGLASGWEVRGREHVPRSGGLIVASNHVSWLDPPLVGTAAVRELHFLAKEELFRPPVFGSVIRTFNAIPIRRGMADLSGMARAIDVLKRGRALVMFPEGTRARQGELLPARPGVGMLAVGSGADIVPCFITGSDRPKQWVLHRGALRVSFGPARSWRDYAGDQAAEPPGRTLYQAIADGVMRDVAALKEQLNTASRGAA
jgi:1-acyl-sn-glycerol-3-phosphate acyltransferase